jgi:flavodoxin I
MKKIGLFYSFNTFKSAQSAKKIQQALGNSNVDMINAEEVNKKLVSSYKNIILSAPTWFDGELPNYWDEFVPELEEMDLAGKRIALFGGGDQKNYPENFVDAIGIMANLLESRGAEIIGFTSTKGYTFEHSEALRGNRFAGLALDFENQGKQINDKIKNWCEQLKKEFH